MADTSPYSDDLEGSGNQQPQGNDDPGSTYDEQILPEEPAEDMDFPADEEESGIEYSDADLDAEPNDTDSQLFPPDDAQDEDEEDFPIDEDLDAGEESPEFEEPNDTDALITAEQLAGTVSFVGVPIGNYGDITQRALRTLQMTDIVVCEDFKAAARLLRSFNMTKKLLEMNERNEDKVSDEVIGLLRAGKRVAVIAGAGLPILADPGGVLAVKLRRMGIEPRIIPGVSSVMVGLMASGFSMDNFDFVGVLPRRPEDRSQAVEELAGRDRTIVMLEAAFRLRSLLAALAEVMPQRQAALTINLTTPFESVVRGTVADLNDRFSRKRFKGEMVLVLDRLEPTNLGLGMSASGAGMDDYEDMEESGGQEESVRQEDAGSRPFRRTARTAAPFAGDHKEEAERRPRREFGERPERNERRGERPAWGERRNDRRSSEGGRERRPGGGERKPGGWNRDGGGGERKTGGWNRDGGGERKTGGWNRDGGGERKTGGWSRDGGGERRSGGWNRDGGGSERKTGGWNRDGGGGERKTGGWNRDGGGGERRSGGWNRDGGGERKPGGWNRDGSGGERRSGGWNRDGGGSERRSGGWNRDGGGGERRSGGEFRGSGGRSAGPRRPGPGRGRPR